MPPTSLREAIETTTRDFLRSTEFAGLVRDPSVVCRSLDPHCERQIVPRSFMASLPLPGPAAPPDRGGGGDGGRLFSNAEAEAAFRENIQVSAVRKTEILNLTVDEEARKSAARTVAVIRFRDGEEITLEESWFFELVEDGSKIKSIVEFCGEELARKRVEKTAALLMQKTAVGGCDALSGLLARGEVELVGHIYDGVRYASMNVGGT